jgi:Putative peptidoglycan binding domain
MKLVPYVVRQGDHLTRLAYKRGFSAEDVWNHPQNADLNAIRKDMDILCPGDVLYIPPEKPPKFQSVMVNAVNRFVASPPKITVTAVLQGPDGPYAGEPYEADGAEPAEGTTGADGKVSFTVGAQAEQIVVTLTKSKVSFRLQIGHLDPIGADSGVRQRLMHLGYHVMAPAAYTRDAELAQAIRAFQADQGLEVTGAIDDATRDALAQQHGS